MSDREFVTSELDNLPSPPRRWAFGEHADCLERPLEPGDELTVVNAGPHRLRVVAARECDPADPRHAAWTERCGRLERERDGLLGERDRSLREFVEFYRVFAAEVDHDAGVYSLADAAARGVAECTGIDLAAVRKAAGLAEDAGDDGDAGPTATEGESR